MQQLIEGMKKNTNVKILSLANIEMPDSIGKVSINQPRSVSSQSLLKSFSFLISGCD